MMKLFHVLLLLLAVLLSLPAWSESSLARPELRPATRSIPTKKNPQKDRIQMQKAAPVTRVQKLSQKLDREGGRLNRQGKLSR